MDAVMALQSAVEQMSLEGMLLAALGMLQPVGKGFVWTGVLRRRLLIQGTNCLSDREVVKKYF
jgi:hypothetical protein